MSWKVGVSEATRVRQVLHTCVVFIKQRAQAMYGGAVRMGVAAGLLIGARASAVGCG